MELLAEGRMAEVYAYGDGTVVKLDRPEWNGVSAFESEVVTRLAEAGLPVARSHGVVTIDGRCGVVLDRILGSELAHLLEGAHEETSAALSERFAELQMAINRSVVDGLPDLVTRLGSEIAAGDLPPALMTELDGLLHQLDDGTRGVCHFDFHPANVLVSASEWVVIDWLAVASGPPMADLARTLVLWGRSGAPEVDAFMRRVRRRGLELRHADDTACDAWIRVVAGARLLEGLGESDMAWLREVAEGNLRLFL